MHVLLSAKALGCGGISFLEKQSQKQRLEVVSLALIRWCSIPGSVFTCGAKRSKCNHEYVNDSSLDTVGKSGADFVPLRELVAGLHYSKIQTSELREKLFGWSLISGSVCLSSIWVLA